MSIFGNLSTEGLEEAQDRLGGFSVLESDIYTGTVKVAYMMESHGGAVGVVLIGDFGGREYRETFWVTNQKKLNFFIKDGKKIPLPGFSMVENICLIATGKTLQEQEDTVEEKVVNIYDPDLKKEAPKSVPVLTSLTGQKLSLAISKVRENKTAKNTAGEYEPTSEERVINTIDAVFHPEMRLTVSEAKNGTEAPQFWDAWVKRNKGNERDRRKIKDGQAQGGKPGRPGAAASNVAPQPGQAPSGRKSLFGNKG